MQLIGSKIQSIFLGHIKLQVHKIEKKCNVGQHKCNNFRPWTCTQPQIKMLTLNEKTTLRHSHTILHKRVQLPKVA